MEAILIASRDYVSEGEYVTWSILHDSDFTLSESVFFDYNGPSNNDLGIGWVGWYGGRNEYGLGFYAYSGSSIECTVRTITYK